MSKTQFKDTLDSIMKYAEVIAEGQIKECECNMFRNLNQFPQCLNALRIIGCARKKLMLPEENNPIIEQLVSGYVEYAGVLAMLAYLNGVQDGAHFYQSALEGNLRQP